MGPKQYVGGDDRQSFEDKESWPSKKYRLDNILLYLVGSRLYLVGCVRMCVYMYMFGSKFLVFFSDLYYWCLPPTNFILQLGILHYKSL